MFSYDPNLTIQYIVFIVQCLGSHLFHTTENPCWDKGWYSLFHSRNPSTEAVSEIASPECSVYSPVFYAWLRIYLAGYVTPCVRNKKHHSPSRRIWVRLFIHCRSCATTGYDYTKKKSILINISLSKAWFPPTLKYLFLFQLLYAESIVTSYIY